MLHNILQVIEPKLFVFLKKYGYKKEDFYKDLLASLSVAIVALPLSLAIAIASNLPPERGLFTAIVAGFLISFLGGSRLQIGGRSWCSCCREVPRGSSGFNHDAAQDLRIHL